MKRHLQICKTLNALTCKCLKIDTLKYIFARGKGRTMKRLAAQAYSNAKLCRGTVPDQQARPPYWPLIRPVTDAKGRVDSGY